jgi:hypothetical protein
MPVRMGLRERIKVIELTCKGNVFRAASYDGFIERNRCYTVDPRSRGWRQLLSFD